MHVQKREIDELCKCYKCDCETADCGICTWFGEPCAECFDLTTYSHLQPNPRHPSRFLKNSHHPEKLRRSVSHAEIEEISTDGNGDCLYECIATALSTTGLHRISISDIRAFVARKQNDETFSIYKSLAGRTRSNTDFEEYQCLKKVRTLRGFKNVIQRCGANVGPDECMWGDENTLQVLADGYRLRFAIFDHTGNLIQIIEPNQENRSAVCSVLLRLYRHTVGNEHFNLLRFNNQTLLSQHEWEWLHDRS